MSSLLDMSLDEIVSKKKLDRKRGSRNSRFIGDDIAADGDTSSAWYESGNRQNFRNDRTSARNNNHITRQQMYLNRKIFDGNYHQSPSTNLRYVSNRRIFKFNGDFSGNDRRINNYRKRNFLLGGGPISNRRNYENPRTLNVVVKISNLDYSIMEDDLHELFSAVGEISKVWIDFDRTDRSEGTGGCIFKNPRDAEKAVKLYNGKLMEGLPVKLEILNPGESTRSNFEKNNILFGRSRN